MYVVPGVRPSINTFSSSSAKYSFPLNKTPISVGDRLSSLYVPPIFKFAVVWVVVGKYLSRKVYFEKPTGFVVSSVEENKVTLTWNSVMYAKEYSIYYKVENNSSSTYYSEKCEYTFILEEGKTYTFYLYVGENDLFGKSEEVSVTYTLSDS